MTASGTSFLRLAKKRTNSKVTSPFICSEIDVFKNRRSSPRSRLGAKRELSKYTKSSAASSDNCAQFQEQKQDFSRSISTYRTQFRVTVSN